ncbi:hypothetical protein ACF0H5_005603 [Mactra antiquata]
MLSEYCKNKKTKLFCAFVDFKKAFDSVWRAGLWAKLFKYNVNGKLFSIIKNLYENVKSCLLINNTKSDFFQCSRGVRQGENLSPILFSLYLNDLEHYMLSNNVTSVNIADHDLDIYLKLIVLLYADDTVIFANTECDLISSLDIFIDYCKTWKLDINVAKTKILVFGDRPSRIRHIASQNYVFEVVDTFIYLGVLFSKNRKFSKAKEYAVAQSRKALFSLYVKLRNLDLPLDCVLKLFDNTVVPVLLYACEIWGYGDLSSIEKVQTDFLKYILHVKKSTPHIMLYGDLGRFPLDITIKKRIIGYWYKLTHNQYLLSSNLYRVVHNDFSVNNKIYPWLSNVKKIFDECGLSYIWQGQYFQGSKHELLNLLEISLKDQYRQSWSNAIFESAKCLNYRTYKTEHTLEKFYTELPNQFLQPFINFRLCNNYLPVEKGRWIGLDRNDRKCFLCNLNDIGDEFHYILQCKFFKNERHKFLPFVNFRKSNILIFKRIMNEENVDRLTQICKFIKIILKTFNNPPGFNN